MNRVSACHWFALVAVFALVSGCASQPDIRVTADPAANLATYRTFNYVQPLGTDREGYESIVSGALKDVTTAELTRRGYRLSDTPDFLVNFGARLDDKLRVTSTPVVGPPPIGYYRYRRGFYDPWFGYNDVNVDQYTEGTLNIDIVDAAAKRLVWEAIAVGRVNRRDREKLPAVVREVVPQMLAKFPSAGGGPPPAPGAQ
ncbi:MAG: hypothetical protein CMLOHMNK_00494 [Steroidobacteraceae bacterium]|nr:hypothetical protein [Steroidobacteraceae bacterium]